MIYRGAFSAPLLSPIRIMATVKREGISSSRIIKERLGLPGAFSFAQPYPHQEIVAKMGIV
jgi:hypothetical protein